MTMTHVRTQHLSLLVALAGAVALSACGKKEEPAPPPPATAPAPAPAPTTPPPPAAAPVAVDSVDLGSAGDATSNKITTPTTTFTPKDTIYASVATTGAAPNAELKAKWTFQDGQTVKETSQTIAPNGPANTLFKIEKPDGWPVGNYKVEILLNGTSTQTKEFSVK
jgi:multidrug efflux pump subunit AcrA (membrane-fusion protein)